MHKRALVEDVLDRIMNEKNLPSHLDFRLFLLNKSSNCYIRVFNNEEVLSKIILDEYELYKYSSQTSDSFFPD